MPVLLFYIQDKSTLDRTDGKSLQEELLPCQEHDEYRHDCHTAGCHGQVVLSYLRSYELVQRQRDGPLSPYCLIMKVADTAIMLGTISARWELVRPTSENITNRGIRVS